MALTLLSICSDAAPGGRLYKKEQKLKIRWSNDKYLISIGRPPNPPGFKKVLKVLKSEGRCKTVCKRAKSS